MVGKWINRWGPVAWRYQRALRAHANGRLTGHYQTVSVTLPSAVIDRPQRIHCWTPHLTWPSTIRHVENVLPHLRAQTAALSLPWEITAGAELPNRYVDWLLCLKEIPPAKHCSTEHTVLLLCDDADRVWGELRQFGHVVSVASPVLASLLGTVHPRAWFVEETESTDTIIHGERALDHQPPSRRPPLLLWHGLRESLDGLLPLRSALAMFARENGMELVVVTNLPPHEEQWGALRVRFVAWSPEKLAEMAGQSRLGIVPARPPLSESYLKSAGRLRHLFALGCPSIGDARSADVRTFSRAVEMPAASTTEEWLMALRRLWGNPAGLDALAQRGHALVRERYSVTRTAAQWLWFLAGGANGKR